MSWTVVLRYGNFNQYVRGKLQQPAVKDVEEVIKPNSPVSDKMRVAVCYKRCHGLARMQCAVTSLRAITYNSPKRRMRMEEDKLSESFKINRYRADDVVVVPGE